MTATAKKSARTSKTAAKSAAKTAPATDPHTPEPRDPRDADAPSTTSDGAITEPATSSQQAAEQRQANPDATPASVGGEASAKSADEAKTLALPEAPVSPATSPGLEQRAVEESRLRAHLVGEQTRLTSDVGRGTAQAGQAETRTVPRLVVQPQPDQKYIEHQEVAVPIGDGRELVFREDFGGHVEVAFNDPNRVNAMRSAGPFDNITKLTPEQAQAVAKILTKGGAGGQNAPEGQSAAEQRSGVATEGGDPGPAAPTPIFPR